MSAATDSRALDLQMLRRAFWGNTSEMGVEYTSVDRVPRESMANR